MILWLALSLANPLPQCADLDPSEVRVRRSGPRVGLFRNTARIWLRVWQLGISPADGATCTKYPSCSQYAVQAVREEGVFVAPFLATDRILSDHADTDLDRCRSGDRIFLYEPVRRRAPWRRRR